MRCYKAMLLTGSEPSTHAFYRACGFDLTLSRHTWHGLRGQNGVMQEGSSIAVACRTPRSMDQ